MFGYFFLINEKILSPKIIINWLNKITLRRHMAMIDDCRKYFTKNWENKGKFLSLYIQILQNHKMETVVDSKRKYNCIYRSSLELPFWASSDNFSLNVKSSGIIIG